MHKGVNEKIDGWMGGCRTDELSIQLSIQIGNFKFLPPDGDNVRFMFPCNIKKQPTKRTKPTVEEIEAQKSSLRWKK